jgi:hypothetical protein
MEQKDNLVEPFFKLIFIWNGVECCVELKVVVKLV